MNEKINKNALAKTMRETKTKTISQIASIGRKHKFLKYPILLFLIVFIIVYNFIFSFCINLKMKERMARALALAMSFVLIVTSIDLTAFAIDNDDVQQTAEEAYGDSLSRDSGDEFEGEDDIDFSVKNIMSILPLDEKLSAFKVRPGTTIDEIEFPETLNVHVQYKIERFEKVEKVVDKSEGEKKTENPEEEIIDEPESEEDLEPTEELKPEESESESEEIEGQTEGQPEYQPEEQAETINL